VVLRGNIHLAFESSSRTTPIENRTILLTPYLLPGATYDHNLTIVHGHPDPAEALRIQF
jgi:hypothetical protein